MPHIKTHHPDNSNHVGRDDATGGIAIAIRNDGEDRLNCEVSFSLGIASTYRQTFS